ncbi:hypothetical protein BHM03_00037846 [Ensete ventricosum]|nr:hypothetical protein BHM03_00037846 [Ensete ventricosum]
MRHVSTLTDSPYEVATPKVTVEVRPSVLSTYHSVSIKPSLVSTRQGEGEQLRQVNQRLDEVQREFVKSKEEICESFKGGSLFVS